MFDPHFEFRAAPLAYFITFRTYGTWLHGDERGSVDRFHNVYGTERAPPNRLRREYIESLMKRSPVRLNRSQRRSAEIGIRSLCKNRSWTLWALNARTTHVHIVVTADCDSDVARAALKGAATKQMREDGVWKSQETPWAEKGSRRKIWTDRQLQFAIDYVIYDQGP